MPVLDISVLSASNIQGVPSKKSFCVYVRLQGQAMRTKTVSGHNDKVTFNERFRFQYRPPRENINDDKNRLFVELWVKSTFSQSCVAVAWTSMDQDFVQRRQVVLNMTGNFEGKSATVTVSLLPLDFGRPEQGPPPQMNYVPPQPQQNYVPQQLPPQQNYLPPSQPTFPPALYSQPTPQPLGYNGPAEGVPLQQTVSPYTTSAYMPQQPQNNGCEAAPLPPQQCQAAPLPPQQYHVCEAAPLPPYDPSGHAGDDLPPPQYPSTILRDRK